MQSYTCRKNNGTGGREQKRERERETEEREKEDEQNGMHNSMH